MRLYRGLKETYKPGYRPDRPTGVDFTDNPYVATLYATGRIGQVLVLDVPDDLATVRVTNAFWFDRRARRLIVWGEFDDFIVAMIPAKELRKVARTKGVAGASEDYKAIVLKNAIERALLVATTLPIETIEQRLERPLPATSGLLFGRPEINCDGVAPA
jgi:hypothetical protein